MNDSVEKSCWNITFWAVAIVVAVALIGSFVLSGDVTAGVEVTTKAAI